MGNSDFCERGCAIRVVAGLSTWVEGEALRQLDAVSRYPGMVACVGLPDIHPGKGTPIGAAFLSQGVLYPHLVGNDIGCGMGLWMTEFPVRKAKADKLAAKLNGLDGPIDDSGESQRKKLADAGLPEDFAHALGTAGRGNHFLELQQVHAVVDAAAFSALGLDREYVFALVHTGSRGLGEAILWRHAQHHGAQGLPEDSEAAALYLADHAQAVAYAELNRRVCAERLFSAIGTEGRRILDSCHNQVSRSGRQGQSGWLHRKGASPAEGPAAIIPGSRGDISYLVAPVPGQEDTLFSLAHGAGRKIARQEAKDRLQHRHRRGDLGTTPLGGRVVCGDERLLWEEAPDCYKPAASVVAALVEAGLCRVIATLAPVVTFKTSLEPADERRRASHDRRERHQARALKEGGWR
ncbi:RNA ligase RtcB family protein [Phaeospirillum tilakii]|uniref:tRNA-splicing ligase RtcB n=1 Tax=Phaeospirillum tilakii TaxID=741673 RepID=A0ABW5CDZ8_9PROT